MNDIIKHNAKALSLNPVKVVVYKLLLSSVLLALSVGAIYAEINTLSFAKHYFNMHSELALKWFIYLYVLLTATQFSGWFIIVVWSKGAVKDTAVLLISGLILISCMDAYKNVRSDPMRYLEPLKYKQQLERSQFIRV